MRVVREHFRRVGYYGFHELYERRGASGSPH